MRAIDVFVSMLEWNEQQWDSNIECLRRKTYTLHSVDRTFFAFYVYRVRALVCHKAAVLFFMRASYIRWFHFTCPFSHQDTFIERDSVDLRWLEPERQICNFKWGERTRATERIGESKRKRRKCVSFRRREKANQMKKPFDHGVLSYRIECAYTVENFSKSLLK